MMLFVGLGKFMKKSFSLCSLMETRRFELFFDFLPFFLVNEELFGFFLLTAVIVIGSSKTRAGG